MERLYELFRENFGVDPETVVELTGSGSNRRYFRLAAAQTVIGVIGTDRQENEAFISLAGHLLGKGISVPLVLATGGDGMAYLQEDLGDDVLGDRVAAVNKGGGFAQNDEGNETVRLLCETVALLPKIQFEGGAGMDFSRCYPQPEFDRRTVMFDLNYFKYCFLKPSGIEFNEVRLQDDLENLANALLEEGGDTFLYRDFNARNVMIKDGKPYFIDFQGGRRGPVHYDVASFVWQARTGYPRWLKDKMIDIYLESLSVYRTVDRDRFVCRLNLFVLFRTLQVLGAYGFRGLIEHKAKFITAIPQAVANLRELLDGIEDEYPYLCETLRSMTAIPRFEVPEHEDGRLEVRVCSFSYRKGIPQDMSGNGGGYVFDCRSIENPGRYEPYRKLTGRDVEVIRFLEEDGEITGYLKHVYGVVDPHVETFCRRGFTSLTVSFGCTGGQHRSVYCAEHLARHLADKYPDVKVRLNHREQDITEDFN